MDELRSQRLVSFPDPAGPLEVYLDWAPEPGLEGHLEVHVTPEDSQELEELILSEGGHIRRRGLASGQLVPFILEQLDGETLAAIVAAVGAWLARHQGRKIIVSKGDRRIELTGLSPDEMDRQLKDFYSALESDSDPDSIGDSNDEE